MSFRVLWFVVAGFVIGFTTSTLWEWLYYRRKRLAMLAEHGAFVREVGRTQRAGTEAMTADADGANWSAPAYRSPGIFLESEQPPVDAAFTGAAFSPSAPAAPTPPADLSAHQPELRSLVSPAVPVEPLARKPTPSAVPSTAQTDAGAPDAAPALTSEPAQGAVVDDPSDDEAGADFTETDFTDDEPTPLPATDDDNAQVEPATFQLVDLITVTQSTVAVPPIPATAASSEAQPPEPGLPTASDAATPPGAEDANTRRARPDDYPDDLAMIKGIGEAYKRKLYATSIYTWRQVAESDLDSLRRITRAKPNADIQSWQTQARELAEKYDRWQARFAGPLDDLTQIDGIGAITADMLYKAGICTYGALAQTSPDELARIVPAPTVGSENDFDGWIRAAARLETIKRKNNGLLP